jgi:hypothetical protein
MAQTKKNWRRRRAVGLGLLTAVLLSTLWFLYAQGQERLAEPLSDGLWRLYTLLQSLPQERLWNLLLVLVFIDAAALLLGVRYVQMRAEGRRPFVGRVGVWWEMLQAAGLPGFLGQRLIGAARTLLIDDLVQRENKPFADVRQRALRGRLPISAEAQRLLGYRPAPQDEPTMSREQRRRLILNVMDEIAAYLEQGNDEERKT